jgi:hypothetical protein
MYHSGADPNQASSGASGGLRQSRGRLATRNRKIDSVAWISCTVTCERQEQAGDIWRQLICPHHRARYKVSTRTHAAPPCYISGGCCFLKSACDGTTGVIRTRWEYYLQRISSSRSPWHCSQEVTPHPGQRLESG